MRKLLVLVGGAFVVLVMSSTTAHAQADCVSASVSASTSTTVADCVTDLGVIQERYTGFTVEWEYERTANTTGGNPAAPAAKVKEFLVRYQENETGVFVVTAGAKPIKEMKVRINRDEDDEDHEVEITDAIPGKTYTVGVSSTPSNSQHTRSGEQTATGDADSPTAPDDVRNLVLTAGNAQIMAMWAEATDNGSPVTGYEVQHREMGKDWPTTGARSGSTMDTSTMWTVSNLKNGTEYDVRVRAYSHGAADDAGWSDVESAIPSEDAAMTPTPALPIFGAFALGAGLLAAGRRRMKQQRLLR
jgi:hypothetical protein